LQQEHTKKTNGFAELWPKDPVVAGSLGTWEITYTAGEDQIEAGGVVRFTIPHRFTRPQIDLPVDPGFVTAYTNKPGTHLEVFMKEYVWWVKGERRSKHENLSEVTGIGVYVRIWGKPLVEGDRVTLVYGDKSYGSLGAYAPEVTACKPEFTVATDSNGRLEAPFSGYYKITNPPTLEVLPREAESLIVTIPSNIETNKHFTASIVARDMFANIATGYRGNVELYLNDGDLLVQTEFKSEDKGVKNVSLVVPEEGNISIQAIDKEKELEARSNSAICAGESGITQYKHYWGDIHGHISFTWGGGTPESYYEYAKDVASLDFASLTEPDAGKYTSDPKHAEEDATHLLSKEEWEIIKEVNDKYYNPHQFVTILGYEYHNDGPGTEFGGDRNVYYLNNDEPLFSCTDEQSFTPPQLWEMLNRRQAITVPHHTAKNVMLTNWDLHDAYHQRLVEIYSGWGNSEGPGCERPILGGGNYFGYSVQDALNRGYRLGFVGGSDTHVGCPGYSYWVHRRKGYRNGMTCAVAKELTREGIWEAFWNRRVYATTGERILLTFYINDAIMGEEIQVKEGAPVNLKVWVLGSDTIEKVEIIRQGKTIYCQKADSNEVSIDFVDESFFDLSWAYYYIRVTQKDKGLAWSSPIWVVSI